jgi:hypothetical protein
VGQEVGGFRAGGLLDRVPLGELSFGRKSEIPPEQHGVVLLYT